MSVWAVKVYGWYRLLLFQIVCCVSAVPAVEMEPENKSLAIPT